MRLGLVVVLVSGTSYADPESTRVPVGALVTAGIGTAGINDLSYQDYDSDFEPVTSTQLDIGYRFHDRVMAGVHVGFTSGVSQREGYGFTMYYEEWLYTYRPMQLGVTSHVMLGGPFYVAPWLGVQRGWRRLECSTYVWNGMPGRPNETHCTRGEWESHGGTAMALGLTVGRDVIESGDHRLTVTASLTHALEHDAYAYSYTSLWLGVGYRFWAR